jgi:hypothetical protein
MQLAELIHRLSSVAPVLTLHRYGGDQVRIGKEQRLACNGDHLCFLYGDVTPGTVELANAVTGTKMLEQEKGLWYGVHRRSDA